MKRNVYIKEFRRRASSFKYAFKGLYIFLLFEHNAWIHCIIAFIVCAAGFYFNITKMEWATIAICIAIVLAAEAFNTAIEKVVDIASPHYSKLAGEAKDIAAAGVLISAIFAAIVGLIIFLPYC